jgi:hypothetical protein
LASPGKRAVPQAAGSEDERSGDEGHGRDHPVAGLYVPQEIHRILLDESRFRVLSI